jgi:hypothetical protein
LRGPVTSTTSSLTGGFGGATGRALLLYTGAVTDERENRRSCGCKPW